MQSFLIVNFYVTFREREIVGSRKASLQHLGDVFFHGAIFENVLERFCVPFDELGVRRNQKNSSTDPPVRMMVRIK